MRGKSFSASVEGGQLGGWVEGAGAPVLLLHGGPGLSFGYLDGLADDIGDGYEVAAFQQRGIAPSMLDGPFDVDTHVADVAAVLDALDWQMAYVVGHSWGGHLSFHIAAAMPERLLGVLSVDPLGAVGDGGAEKFEAEILARMPDASRAAAVELDERAIAGEGSEADGLKSLELVWPAYFASWDAAPPMPPTSMSVPAYSGGYESMQVRLPALQAALPAIEVPVGIVAGARSPMPIHEAAELTAGQIPGAWVEAVPAAGHFPWIEQPGCVRAGLERLASL
jgi:pimeloyl-ACP methyl ester carboxylesterase